MKVIVIEFNGLEHEVDREPPFTSVWAAPSHDGLRIFVADAQWRNYTMPVFRETLVTSFELVEVKK